MTKQAPKKTRINMRVPDDLLGWAKEYALLRNTNLTQLLVDYLTKLKLGDKNE